MDHFFQHFKMNNMKRLLSIIIFSLWSALSFAQLDIIAESNEDEDKYTIVKRNWAIKLCRLEGRDSTYFTLSYTNDGTLSLERFYLGDGIESAKKTLSQLIKIIETKPHGHVLAIDNKGKKLTLVLEKRLNKRFLVKKGNREFYLDIINLRRFYDFLATNKSAENNRTEEAAEENQDYQ